MSFMFIRLRFLVNSGALLSVNTSRRLHLCATSDVQLLCRNNIENYWTCRIKEIENFHIAHTFN